MTFANTCCEQTELGGGRFESVHHIKPVAHNHRGTLKRNVLAYESKGDLARPLVLDRAPLTAKMATDGSAHFHPTRDDNVWVGFGAPQMKAGTQFSPVAVSAPSLSKVQAVAWDNPNFTMEWIHGGHFASWLMRPRAGWKVPGGTLLFPVTMAGLELKGDTFLSRGEPVCSLRAPYVHDLANLMDVRPVKYEWVTVGKGLALVLSGIKTDGMQDPEIEPTLELQPDASAGKDTIIDSGNPTFNNGVSVYSAIGWFNASTSYKQLLQFVLTSIPSTAMVAAATLFLSLKTPDSTQSYNYGAYRILQAWIEGTGNGSATGNGATWNTYDGVNNWATAGCNDTTTDRLATPENLHTINYATDNSWSIPVMTQIWISTPANNRGVAVCTLDAWIAAGRWLASSSDDPTPAKRPELRVDYTLGGGGIFQSGIFVSGIIYSGIVH